MIIICFGGGSTTTTQATPAVAPPAPEPTPEEVITPEDTQSKSGERKQTKAKRTGLSAYKADLNTETSSGINVPV